MTFRSPSAALTTSRSLSSVLQFFALAFGISWILGLAAAAILQAILPESMERVTLLLAKFGPSIAGLMMAYSVSGRSGLVSLLRHSCRWRTHGGWYIVALLLPAFGWFCGLSFVHLTGGEVNWTIFGEIGPADVVITLGTFVFFGGGLGEELGWRGFALPMLQHRMSAARASLLIGFVWAAWHYPAILLDSSGDASPIWVFTLFVVAATFVMTWLFNSTSGNLLLAILFHASVNASERLMDGAVTGVAETRCEIATAVVYAVLALVALCLFGGRSLSRRDRTLWPVPKDDAIDPE